MVEDFSSKLMFGFKEKKNERKLKFIKETIENTSHKSPFMNYSFQYI